MSGRFKQDPPSSASSDRSVSILGARGETRTPGLGWEGEGDARASSMARKMRRKMHCGEGKGREGESASKDKQRERETHGGDAASWLRIL